MSVFRVKLYNTEQGLLDPAVSGGKSLQRTVYVMGPGKINRKLKDGDTFTDSNYWKRFAYPQVPLNEAIVEVVTDDGSTYSDIPEENNFPYTWMNVAVNAGTTYAANVVDILGTTGGNAIFTQVISTQAIKMRINGSANAIVDLLANTAQIYNLNELVISKLEFDNSASGASNAVVDVQVSVRSVSKS